MDIDFRLKYYLGNLYLYYKFNKIIKYDFKNKNELITYNKIQYIDNDIIFSNDFDPQIKYYIYDLRKYIKQANINKFKFLIVFGDINISYDKFVITKTRPINSTNNIILNLNSDRHWSSLKEVDLYDIEFKNKNNKLVWRGTDTGFQRYSLVSQFQNCSNLNIDIKFSNIINKNNNYIINKLSIKELLQNKFLLSIEGNDVATNLKWIIYSNSLVIMPKPTICSWFMEDKLIPNFHYIEIKSDYSDLEEKFIWCCNNLDLCYQIIKNAKVYIKQFLNEKTEKEITNKIIEIYNKTIQII